MTDAGSWRAIGMLNAGMSVWAVGRHFGRSHTTIARFLKKSRANGAVSHAGAGSRHTSARADRRLLQMVRGNPTLHATATTDVGRKKSQRQHCELGHDSKSDSRARASLKEDALTPPTETCACSTQKTVVNATTSLEATTMEASHLHGRKSNSPVPQ